MLVRSDACADVNFRVGENCCSVLNDLWGESFVFDRWRARSLLGGM